MQVPEMLTTVHTIAHSDQIKYNKNKDTQTL